MVKCSFTCFSFEEHDKLALCEWTNALGLKTMILSVICGPFLATFYLLIGQFPIRDWRDHMKERNRPGVGVKKAPRLLSTQFGLISLKI